MAETRGLSPGEVICRSGELVERGAGIRFSVDRPGRIEPAFVVRYEGRARAYFNRCAHVPTELDWLHGEFFDADRRFLICATHGALYAPDSGRCVGGRCAGKGLEALAVVERDGLVILAGADANE